MKMWRRLIIVLPLILSITAIKVPVDDKEDDTTEAVSSTSDDSQKPINYYTQDDTNLDSYLIPPNPHQSHEVLPDSVITPATYLLPPSSEQQPGYYYPSTEPGEQSDWYPIAQGKPIPLQTPSILPPLKIETEVPVFSTNPKESKKLRGIRVGRVRDLEKFDPRKPILNLEPPSVSAPDEYAFKTPSEQLELPFEETLHVKPSNFKPPYVDTDSRNHLQTHSINPIEPTLALHLVPPKPLSKHKVPTKLYPKKYPGEFKPVSIPIAQFADDLIEIPKAKPVKPFHPIANIENDFVPQLDDKRIFLYQQAEEKRKLKNEIQVPQHQHFESGPLQSYTEAIPSEQDVSETHYASPGRNAYPAPLRQARNSKSSPAPDERTEFRMHGMKGPHSYQFGYDTGKGKNRQFRYEERDNDGLIKGHYGYMDKRGKLRVVNYSAHPELGFHAEAPVETEQ
ncbi:uncharacterized protein LOC101741297 [Bombyx mori]|uniref:Cuticle protein n=1 Tax=Bombyx mori TaxID=7091 RepID=A0A8R2AN11_BOMMO|nr:uncharacterized protein LOC101741297 [Bombyx mori]